MGNPSQQSSTSGQVPASRPTDPTAYSGDVPSLPAVLDGASHDTSESTSDQPNWRLQKQRPLAATQRGNAEGLTRPGDIIVGSQDPLRRNSSPLSGRISPGHPLRSDSPRRISPATSQIFERDVQETTTFAPELSPAIPSHIQTEDHIPPVLEPASLAITDGDLNPDEVEIVMHSGHLPAVVAVGGAALSDSQPSTHGSPPTDMMLHPDSEDANSTYGAVDTSDPRRLSFISFADVVHAEQAESNKDGGHPLSMSSAAQSIRDNRSPSPVRSPLIGERVGVSPPTSGPASMRGMDASPVRSVPLAHGGSNQGSVPHGELTIETMRQTMQKTGSAEMPGMVSQPMSASSGDSGSVPKPLR